MGSEVGKATGRGSGAEYASAVPFSPPSVFFRFLLRMDKMSCIRRSIIIAGIVVFSAGYHLKAGDLRAKSLDFNKTYLFLCTKGRVQDHEYCPSRFPDRIIAQGTAAIPLLISRITDARRTKRPQFPYWSYTANGDVAYFILMDLFRDSDWASATLPGLPDLTCNESEPTETCWREFLKEHGREYVRRKCLEAWEANKARVYWDENSRCFRVHAVAREGGK
jgi:hypothetical protein